jgi:hypothetical protein
MRKIRKITLSFMALFLSLAPVSALAAGFVPCTDGKDCNFDALMTLIDNVTRFIFFDMAIPIAAIMFAYAGFLLITAGAESAGAKTKAKSIFTSTVLGLVIAMAAWIIVELILTTLGFVGPGLV